MIPMSIDFRPKPLFGSIYLRFELLQLIGHCCGRISDEDFVHSTNAQNIDSGHRPSISLSISKEMAIKKRNSFDDIDQHNGTLLRISTRIKSLLSFRFGTNPSRRHDCALSAMGPSIECEWKSLGINNIGNHEKGLGRQRRMQKFKIRIHFGDDAVAWCRQLPTIDGRERRKRGKHT